MIKKFFSKHPRLGKSLAAVAMFTLVFAVFAYINLHHIYRFHYNLPAFTHEAGKKFTEQMQTRDGIKLHTRIYLPEGEQAWPTVLLRNPYQIMDRYFNVICNAYIRYGYACVLQHTRGQGKSEGEWEPLVNEPADGSDTLYWLAKQKWVDGNIGMWGISYLALVQWAAAFDYPPELKTFVPISMGTDFHKTLFENGAFRHFVTWWMMVMPDSKPDMSNGEEDNFLAATKFRPHFEVDKKFTDKTLSWYREWISSVSKNAPIWSREDAIQLSQVAENLQIPVLMLDGWYDPFFGSLFQDYLDLGTRDQSVLVIGPWNHMQQVAGDVLNDDIPSASEMAMQLTLEWFDYYLKNNKTKTREAGYIKVYDVGSNQWQTYQSWPPTHAVKNFYFDVFENANLCEGGILRSEEVHQQQKISYLFDPQDPVKTKGGSSFIVPLSDELKPGAVFQGDICLREDVLSFISEPLTEDMTLAGSARVYLSVSSNAPDTMFTAKLMDVLPDGSAVNIRDSATTLSYRNGSADALVYEPDSVVDVAIDMWAMQWTLKKGHRVRVDISSSNFPAFNIHSNFAGPWEQQTQTQTAQQTLYSPSSLQLPILVTAP